MVKEAEEVHRGNDQRKENFFIKTNIFIVTNGSGLDYAWKDIERPRVAAGLF